jgi:hypothetical protein
MENCFTRKLIRLAYAASLFLAITAARGQTPVAGNGQLSVAGSRMHNQHGQEYQLRGN